MKRRYVVIDLETTGNSPKTGERIIQFAAVVIEKNKIVDTYSTFVNPEKEIPPFITNLTGIKDEDVKDAPLFSTIIPQLFHLFEDSVFVAHNIHFDYVFLENEFERLGYVFPTMPTIDTVELSRILLPTIESYKLNDLAAYLSIHHDRPHQADSDAWVTATLFLTLIDKLKKLPLKTLQQLLQLSKYYKSECSVLLSSIISSNIILNKEEEDYSHVLNVVIKQPTFTLASEQLPSSYQKIYTKVESYAGFKKRMSQLEMMDIIHETFQDNKFAVIEAGTGVGKTLGYLLPAIAYASEREEQVIISTHSIQLQNQIMNETIPLIQAALQTNISVCVLKGRKHYLSLYKFSAALNQDDSNYEVVLTKSKILVWLTQTTTGDVDELNLPSGGISFWEEICCSYGEKERNYEGVDYYNRAIHQAMMADIIITNHALLLHDISREEQMFEGIQSVIIDEAHRFVEVATTILGKSFSAMYCNQLITKLLQMMDEIKKQDEHSMAIIGEVEQHIRELKLEFDDLFRLLYTVGKKKGKQSAEGNLKQTLPYAKLVDSKESELLKDITERIVAIFKVICSKNNTLNLDVPSYLNNRRIELFHSLEEKIAILMLFFDTQEDSISWIELEQKGSFHSLVLYVQPVTVAQTLRDKFFNKIERGIFTSATLSVEKNFSFFLTESGLDAYSPTTTVLPSPFDYTNKVKVFVPMELPSYKKVHQSIYITLITHTIEQILRHIEGKSLILFQSNELLQIIYDGIKDSVLLKDTVLLSQGNSRNRNRVAKHFKQFNRAALFGGTTFWEGVDFEGAGLQCVIIVRLPFSSPDHPYVKLKSDWLQKAGKSAFNEFSLPQAILRFKQGFGRLIRSEENKGVVFVLDQRVMETHYGPLFLKSIPPVQVSHQSIERCLVDMNEFLKES